MAWISHFGTTASGASRPSSCALLPRMAGRLSWNKWIRGVWPDVVHVSCLPTSRARARPARQATPWSGTSARSSPEGRRRGWFAKQLSPFGERHRCGQRSGGELAQRRGGSAPSSRSFPTASSPRRLPRRAKRPAGSSAFRWTAWSRTLRPGASAQRGVGGDRGGHQGERDRAPAPPRDRRRTARSIFLRRPTPSRSASACATRTAASPVSPDPRRICSPRRT